MMLNLGDLDALRELCNLHLAGQWACDGSEIYRGECAEYNLGWVAETCDIALPDNGASTGSFIVAAVNAVPVLLAELARKDQALEAIAAMAEELRAQAVVIRAGKTSMKSLRAGLREAAAADILRILARLDTQGETR